MTSTAIQVEVKEKHLILSNAEVRAILGGRKTQKRIAIKPQPVVEISRREQANRTWHVEVEWKGMRRRSHGYAGLENGDKVMLESWAEDFCPHGGIGTRLWVREALRCDDRGMYYAADETLIDKDLIPDNLKRVAEFCDPFHMPRWASRITLEITNVRVERLQDINERDAQAEGAQVRDVLYADEPFSAYSYVKQFKLGWDALNARRGFSFASNPWVWVIEFKKL